MMPEYLVPRFDLCPKCGARALDIYRTFTFCGDCTYSSATGSGHGYPISHEKCEEDNDKENVDCAAIDDGEEEV